MIVKTKPSGLRIWQAVFVLLFTACVTLPDRHLPEATYTAAVDSLFLSPLSVEPGGVFSVETPVQNSQATETACIAIFKDFLQRDCLTKEQVLILPELADSLAIVDFDCPMSSSEWMKIYGHVPGESSRLIIIESMELHGLKASFIKSTLEGLNLLDLSGREWGWVETRYRVYDFESDSGSGLQTLLTRLPDTVWTERRQDRAAVLMRQAAHDLSQSLR
jgi:hypothetical protein